MLSQHSVIQRLLLIVFISFLSVLTPRISFAASAVYQSAQKEFVLGNYDKVVTLLKGKTDIDSIILVSRAGHLIDDADDKPLVALLGKEPNNEKALTAMAFIEEESRHYREAQQTLDHIFRTSHQNAQAIAVLALCKVRQGGEEAGMKILADALKLGDKDPIVLELAEGAYDCVFDSVQTEKTCDRLIALQPRNAHYWWLKGRFLERAGKTDKALECYSKAISVNPRFDFAYNSRAKIYFERKDYHKVVSDASACIATPMCKGEVYDALNLRATANGILGKHAEAIADLKEYLRLTDSAHHPEFIKQDEAYLKMGFEYIALGKYTEAENVLVILRKLNRRTSEVLEQEAVIQERLGHKEAAIKLYEKLIKEEGNNPSWVAALKKLKGK
ncbi:MAG: tetratricopeptide repeat protein [Candidatus Obscuribacterales bacterium]|nr:tetratricopeptide repeat protein [Candidatus Obscuribacterales bacterium]